VTASARPRVSLPWLAPVVSVGCLALVLALWAGGALQQGERYWYDLRFRWRGPLPAPTDVVIVAVDDRSLDLLGVEGGSPTRAHFAALVQALGAPPSEAPADAGKVARVIAFDYWLPEIALPTPDCPALFDRMLGLFERSTVVQGAAVPPEDARLFVDFELLGAEDLAGIQANPDDAALAGALDRRARLVSARMAKLERAKGFGEGLSAGYRKLLLPKTVHLLSADLALAATIKNATTPVVLARFISPEGDRLPDPLFEVVSTRGLINALKDPDGVMRSLLAFGQLLVTPGGGDDREYVLPLALAALAAAEGKADLDDTAPDTRINAHPLPSDGTLFVNFRGPARTFRHVPLHCVIRDQCLPERLAEDDAKVAQGIMDPREPPLRTGELAGTVVFVGDTTPAGQDFVATPFSEVRAAVELGGAVESAGAGQLEEMAGVEFHANVFETVRRDAILPRWGTGATVPILLVVAALGLVFYVSALGFRWAIPLVLVLTAIAAWGNYHLFVTTGRLIELVAPLSLLWLQFMAGVTTQGILQARKRAQVTQLFGRYLSPKVVRRMVDEEQALGMEGQTRTVTTLFSDIRGFTKLAESMTAREVGAVLQDYFERMIGVVFAHDGTLDKLMGDAVMAFWGAPEEVPDHPVKTCTAALDMVRALEALRRDDTRPVMQQLDIGIGVNTGEVIVGNLGSHKFVNYTVLGDPVNLASRLEGQNKEYGTRIIVGEATVRAVPDGTFVWRELDSVKVKGKTQPVAIFELVGRPGEIGEARRAALAAFARGLTAWRAGDFVAADAAFAEALAADPADGPARTFRKRCAEYLATPPTGAWDGVYVARSK
jgi:adenylate cyclase